MAQDQSRGSEMEAGVAAPGSGDFEVLAHILRRPDSAADLFATDPDDAAAHRRQILSYAAGTLALIALLGLLLAL